MSEYYVVEKGDEYWDLDDTKFYRTDEEAAAAKAKLEKATGKKYVIWKVE